jgi:hypothetical protein
MAMESRRGMGRGALYGVLAGAIFLGVELIAAALMGNPVLMPIRMFASLLLGQSAMQAAPLGMVLGLGLPVHFALSALFGFIYGALNGLLGVEGRGSYARQAALGLLFGVALWFIDFQVIARFIYPWFLNAPQFMQMMLHAVAFGLPLALLFAASARRVVRPGVDHSPTVPTRRRTV